jgi:antitoxin component YwqK of YwqJK toxin-antitoxin module
MARHLTLLAVLLGLSLSASAQAQRKLPPCPDVDNSKHKHLGLGGRTEKWHNCYGRYVGELNDVNKGDVYEGEFRNGLLNGQGMMIYPDGEKYVGEFKNGNRNGQGTITFANGRVEEGIWADGKFVRAEKIKLPLVNQQIDVSIHEEPIRLDAERRAKIREELIRRGLNVAD